MNWLQDRRVVIGLGVALALVAGLALALFLMGGDKGPTAPPPASQGGLVVNIGRDDDFKAKAPLRCFVNGQFVGEFLLSACAQKNGVATTALDVGIDPTTGALGAAESFGADLIPLPPAQDPGIVLNPPTPVLTPPTAAPPQTEAPAVVRPASGPVCQRYDRTWRPLGEMSLNACVQELFNGRCERAGSASYGRWGEQTLRLVTGRVEISPDDRQFRTLVEVGSSCTIPPL